MQAELSAIKEAGANLVAISPEPSDSSLTTVEKHALEFAVLSDANLAVAGAFGLSYDLPPVMDTLYQNFGMDLRSRNGTTNATLPIPATYVVDTDGKIVFAHVEVDYTRRPEPSDIVAMLQSLK